MAHMEDNAGTVPVGTPKNKTALTNEALMGG